MRDLFFKTTQARHPSALLRFVYSFLRLRNQAVFFVRPRSRFSLFFRLQVLRKMFVWFYTDRFARRSFFRRLIRVRTGTFRTFLNFCTTLETYLPVILYRFRFTDDMREAFYALQAGQVFLNGRRVSQMGCALCLGDFVEVSGVDLFKVLSFRHLIQCLPTLKFRLTLKDSIVNTALFYSLFVRNYSFFGVSTCRVLSAVELEKVVTRLPYLNDQYRESLFFTFFMSRVFLTLFRCTAGVRLWAFRRKVDQLGVVFSVIRRFRGATHSNGQFWWHSLGWTGLTNAIYFPGLLLSGEDLFGGMLDLERDTANVPGYVVNALGSNYSFQAGRLRLN